MHTNPGTWSSGGSFYVVQGDVTSYTYNSTYPNLVATSAKPLEQAVSYNGACNSGSPAYDTTYYYGSAGSCPNAAPEPWLLACMVKQTGGSPASLTTGYQYDQTVGGVSDANIGDVNVTTDPNGNITDTTFDGYGDTLSTTTSASDQCSSCGS